jgi:hypothetical protein
MLKKIITWLVHKCIEHELILNAQEAYVFKLSYMMIRRSPYPRGGLA